jgi:hypothetical protein
MKVERLDEDDPADAGSPAVSQRAAAVDSRGGLTDDLGQPGVAAAFQRYETRDRAAYYEDLRAAVAADRREAASHQAPGEPTAKPVDGGARHEVCWPGSGRLGGSDDPGIQRGNDRQALDTEVDAEVRLGCERIQETEHTVITPAIHEIEAADPGRELVGLDHRLKGDERLKEKVTALLEAQPEMTAGQALASIPDAIRFTFCYAEDRYAAGVRADVDRLNAWGFEMVKLKNTWASDQYKGINAQWREPETGQPFEVQFHTPASFEAKQHSHAAYERIRDPATPDHELDELKHAQRQVCAKVPVPPDTDQIGDYLREKYVG